MKKILNLTLYIWIVCFRNLFNIISQSNKHGRRTRKNSGWRGKFRNNSSNYIKFVTATNCTRSNFLFYWRTDIDCVYVLDIC